MRTVVRLLSCLAIAATPVVLASDAAWASESGVRALVRSYNEAGQDLFARLAQAPGNVVLSPYSIGLAMAMVRSGARGRTDAEMAEVLHHSVERSKLDQANAELAHVLRGYETRAAAVDAQRRGERTSECKAMPALCPGQDGGPGTPSSPLLQLAIANALMVTPTGTREGTLDRAYIDVLRRNYEAEVFRNARLKDVNDWAARKTSGRIDALLSQLEDSARAVILNAVLFKGAWVRKFAKGATQAAPFQLSGGGTAEVPMMGDSGSFALAVRPGYRAVRLPFDAAPIAMVILLPDADLPAGQLPTPSASELAAVFADLDRPPIHLVLRLPRFRAHYDSNLTLPLKAAGMTLAFDADKADFSGMTGRPLKPSLYISSIVHKAHVEVDEDGALATAVTATTFPTKSAPPPPSTSFLVDRPFLFFIVDHETGAILFQGRIEDPRSPPA